MTWLREFARRVAMLLQRAKFERELDEEMRVHREMKERELREEDARCATSRVGVRIALGADARQTLGLVVGQGMKPVGMGLLAGLLGSMALTRTVAGLLYGVSANDRATMVGAALLLGAVGLLACSIPARRAMKVDPMIVLRHE
jgi:hypothetical protein